MLMRRVLAWLSVVSILLLTTAALEATTIVPPADPGELAIQSDSVLMVRAGASFTEKRGSVFFTITPADVVDCLKGCGKAGKRVELEVPGGTLGGQAFVVAGSPDFKVGETYLVFADVGPDGRWQPRLLAESVLLRVEDLLDEAVLMPLPETGEMERYSKTGVHNLSFLVPVYESAFVRQLRAVINAGAQWIDEGVRVPRSRLPVGAKVAPSVCNFMTISAPGGGPLAGQTHDYRWFSNTPSMNWSSALDSDLPGGGDAEVIAAANNWNNVGSTSLNVNSGGPVSVGTSWCDNFPSNAIAFNDPCDAIPDLSGCSGVLGWGGAYVNVSSTSGFDGQDWWRATGWGVMVNNGTGACISSSDYEIFLTHEMGHGLGFDHISSSGDLMSTDCCYDFSSDDVLCAEYLYPPAAATPTPTITPTSGAPTPTSTPTMTPTTGVPTPTPTPTPTATSGVPTPTPTPASSQVLVPVVVHQDGVGGTPWRSDVVVSNRNAGAQTLRLRFQPAGKAVLSATRTLAGLGTLLLEDLVTNLFQAGDARGPLAIEVVSGGSQLPVVVSRAYAENPFGNLGSGLPADVEATTDVVSLPGLFHDDVFRSNIAVTAGDGGGVWATFELFRGADGLVAGGIRRRIDAGREGVVVDPPALWRAGAPRRADDGPGHIGQSRRSVRLVDRSGLHRPGGVLRDGPGDLVDRARRDPRSRT